MLLFSKNSGSSLHKRNENDLMFEDATLVDKLLKIRVYGSFLRLQWDSIIKAPSACQETAIHFHTICIYLDEITKKNVNRNIM